jgi:L-seryl-tRNA(Ser) seleniumtransferase
MNEPGLTWHTVDVTESPYRHLPKVDDIVRAYEGRLPHGIIVGVVRAALELARNEIADNRRPDIDGLVSALIRAMERASGTTVINASGVLLHTNLGRARWSGEAIASAGTAAGNYTNLEIDLESGERSRRGSYITELMGVLTGAEDSLIVNNNAAAVMLALSATSAGLSVPVARGELIEIGGSYRLPQVMEASGARLVEVGTTNRTRAGDYDSALQLHRCGAILKVHPSNYRIDGFVDSPTLADLAAIAESHDVPLVYDIGSGLLDEETPWISGPTPSWLSGEPAARQSLEAGADIVTFSGDKLLGGPQAGVIAGNHATVETLRSHAMARALRVDGSTYAALGVTLEAYANHDVTSLPFWQQALEPVHILAARASDISDQLGGTVVDGFSAIGAGSVPGMTIPTPLVLLADSDRLYQPLLSGDPPVLARRERGGLVIDLRTVRPDDDEVIVEAVEKCR